MPARVTRNASKQPDRVIRVVTRSRSNILVQQQQPVQQPERAPSKRTVSRRTLLTNSSPEKNSTKLKKKTSATSTTNVNNSLNTSISSNTDKENSIKKFNSMLKKKLQRKIANSHNLIKVAKNTVFQDVTSRSWQVGDLIGIGGFGSVYSVRRFYKQPDANPDMDFYAVKFEPDLSGPLFTELAFYQRVCQSEKMQQFLLRHKLPTVCLPEYISTGFYCQAAATSKKSRFLVFTRLGLSLHDVITARKNSLPQDSILLIGYHMTTALQYMHEQGYVHADIKCTNILTDIYLFGDEDDEAGAAGSDVQKAGIYLTDFGLTARYCEKVDAGKAVRHQEYKEIAKFRHNGTVELTSCDSHAGAAPSRRGDLEILLYTLLRVVLVKLPWEVHIPAEMRKNIPVSRAVTLGVSEKIAKEKTLFKKTFESALQKLIPTNKHLCTLFRQLFKMVYQLGYDEAPNYTKIRGLFAEALGDKGLKKAVAARQVDYIVL